MKILVVGGTRFFGIPMINALLDKGHDVTVATRGNAKAPFDDKVAHVIMDRTDGDSACNAGDLGSFPGLRRSPGEGNGNPLQYSCLEKPMEKPMEKAWQATVHGVAESQTQSVGSQRVRLSN